MSYARATYTTTEYAGESFTKEIKKQSGAEWGATETGVYEIYDANGVLVSSGGATKSADNLTLTFTVPYSDTVDFVGNYLLLFYLQDTSDPQVKDVVLEYKIQYLERKGTS